VYVLTLAPTLIVVSPFVKPEFVALWIVKPVSLLELSDQVKLTVGVADAVATRLEGAIGAASVIITAFDGKELPSTLKANTR
jgi:hypothetical protein